MGISQSKKYYSKPKIKLFDNQMITIYNTILNSNYLKK